LGEVGRDARYSGAQSGVPRGCETGRIEWPGALPKIDIHQAETTKEE
jgi:hypothetical protein